MATGNIENSANTCAIDPASGHRPPVIYDTGGKTVISTWVFALFWNAIAIPLAVVFLRDHTSRNAPPAPLVLLFPAIGILLLLIAIFQTARRVRYGRSTLSITPHPAHPGEAVRAVVTVKRALLDVSGALAKLQSVRREVRGSGDSQSTFDNILWETEQPLEMKTSGAATTLSSTFALPGDAVESNNLDRRNRVFWRLIIIGERPGLDFKATFELPVQRRGDDDPAPALTAGMMPTPAVDHTLPVQELARQRVYVTRRAGSDFDIAFPAARRPGMALLLTVFAAGFDSVAVFMARQGGWLVMIFVLGFGGCGLVFTLIALAMWLVRTDVAVTRSGLEITRHILGVPFRNVLAGANIETVSAKQTSSQGERVFYAIDVRSADGKHIRFGGGIEGHRVADRLAENIGRLFLKA